MVLSVPFEWSQTESFIRLELPCSEDLHAFFSPLYIKINDIKSKRFLGIDLAHEIDFENSSTLVEKNGKTAICLKKMQPQIWPSIFSSLDKSTLSQRRAFSIEKGEKALEISAIKYKQHRETIIKTNELFLLKEAEESARAKEAEKTQQKQIAAQKLFSTTHVEDMETESSRFQAENVPPARELGKVIKMTMTPKLFDGNPTRNANPH